MGSILQTSNFRDRLGTMDGPDSATRRTSGPQFRCGIGLLLAMLITPTVFAAETFTERFAGKTTSWSVPGDSRDLRIKSHRRIAGSRDAEPYEYVQIESATRGKTIDIAHRLPSSMVIEETKLSLHWISNRNGATVFLRVVFPRHRDPRTGSALTTLVSGTQYAKSGGWQELVCTVPERQIQARVREFRERDHNPRISADGMYVDAVVIRVPCDAGRIDCGIADLRLSPVVKPTKAPVIKPAGFEKTEDAAKHPAEFRLDRLRVRGFPFVPRMVRYQRERPARLKDVGMNVVWIPRYDDTSLIADLQRAGLWMTATPPGGSATAASSSRYPVRTVTPFGKESYPFLFWNVGTRIEASSQKRLVEWVDRIRQADRKYDRPILGDVAENELVFSRYVSMLGTSRHVLHTSFSLKQYRDLLIQKGNLARPGSFQWTWIQTEPAELSSRGGSDSRFIEPEQIRLLVYAALAAGCRGIGYWTTAALDEDSPAAYERRLIISQLNLELDLLGPWIASGTVAEQTRFTIQQSAEDRIGQRRIDFRSSSSERTQREALLREREVREKRKAQLAQELEAAVIRSEYGTLLLPIWYETDAQFVPGQMAANNAQILVQGVSDAATAWEISTTGIRSLERARVTGGVRITVPKFDQTTAILITTNRKLIDQLRERVKLIEAKSAMLHLELGRAKFDRVRKTNAELASLGNRQTDAPQLMRKASTSLAEAKLAYDRKDYESCRLHCGNAMQLLRILQRAHWNDAVRSLSSPVSEQHAVCYESLPDHWRLVARFGSSKAGNRGNLLRSGDFEDVDTMVAEGWKHTQKSNPSVRAVAELYPKGKKGSYSLRLVAAPVVGKDQPAVLTEPAVTVNSPPITVRSGQMVSISGWVQVPIPIVANLDGAILYDNIGGKRAALRWQGKAGWQRFTMLREAKESGELRLTLSLNGLGEIRFDDLQIVVHDPPTETAARPKPTVPESSEGSRSLFDRFPRLPSIPGLRR